MKARESHSHPPIGQRTQEENQPRLQKHFDGKLALPCRGIFLLWAAQYFLVVFAGGNFFLLII